MANGKEVESVRPDMQPSRSLVLLARSARHPVCWRKVGIKCSDSLSPPKWRVVYWGGGRRISWGLNIATPRRMPTRQMICYSRLLLVRLRATTCQDQCHGRPTKTSRWVNNETFPLLFIWHSNRKAKPSSFCTRFWVKLKNNSQWSKIHIRGDQKVIFL